MTFSHLNDLQRYQIAWRKQQGQSVMTIANAIGVHRATVYRELSRGGRRKGYDLDTAINRARRRQAISTANHPHKSALLWRTVGRYLRQDWSPEQFAGRLKEMGGLDGERVSFQAIYGWLRRTKNSAVTHLRHYQKTQRWCARRGGLPRDRPRIAERPASVEERQTSYDWEGDTIQGGRGRHPVIVTLTERRSLYTRMSAPIPKKATKVARAICRALADTGAQTLTLDNGTEFAEYTYITQTIGVDIYFADPGQPGQRGRNENSNGLKRQYLPKGSSLENIKPSKIRWIENRLNHRPRKSLGYKTPHEVFFNLMPTPVAIRN